MNFASYFFVTIDIFSWSSYNFETFLGTLGTMVPIFFTTLIQTAPNPTLAIHSISNDYTWSISNLWCNCVGLVDLLYPGTTPSYLLPSKITKQTFYQIPTDTIYGHLSLKRG